MPIPALTHTRPSGTTKAHPLDWDDAPSVFWSEAWEDFRITYARQARQTNQSRLSVLRHFASWLQAEHGITDPAQVERRHVQQYMNLQEEARTGSGVLNVYKDLRVFFRFFAGTVRDCDECLDREIYRSHSCKLTQVHGVKKPAPPAHPSKTVHVLTDDEWAAVLKAAGDGRTVTSARNRAILLLMADSGLRRAEVHALKVGDVDLDSHTVLMRRGKGGKRRVSVLGDQARLAIRKYLKLRADKYTADSPLWVATRSGRQLSYVYLGKLLTEIDEATGVDLHAHMTRHMFTDRAYRDGMPIKALMTLGGWSGKIPATYGAGAEQERALAIGQDWLRNRASR